MKTPREVTSEILACFDGKSDGIPGPAVERIVAARGVELLEEAE